MHRLNPPFRCEHVGSLLRPAALLAARRRHAAGDIDAAELRAAEDDAIAAAIGKQQDVGPQCGFSSTVEGNAVTEDDQWAKLEQVVSIAREVWK